MIEFGYKPKNFRASDGVTVYLLGLAALFAVSGVLGSVVLPVIEPLQNTNRLIYEIANMLLNALIQVGLVAVYVIYVRFISVKPQIYVNKTCPVSIIMGAVIAAVTLIGFIVPATLFDLKLIEIGYETTAFEMHTVGGKIFLFIVTVFFAPVGEELIFRSALLSGLKRKFSVPVCVLINGLTFSLMHMNPAQTVYQFALGCSLSLVALCSKSVVPCIIGHSTSNIIACMIQFFPDKANELLNPILSFGQKNTVCMLILMTGAIAVVIGIYFLIKFLEKNKVTYTVAEEPEFFDPKTFKPVFKSDSDYESKSEQFSGLDEGGLGVQNILRKRYNSKYSECGGFLGKNTFFVGLAIGISFCIMMWLLALVAVA